MNAEIAAKIDQIMIDYKIEVELMKFFPAAVINFAKQQDWSLKNTADYLANDADLYVEVRNLAAAYKKLNDVMTGKITL